MRVNRQAPAILHAAMINTIKNTYRLTKAGATLAWHGFAFVPTRSRFPDRFAFCAEPAMEYPSPSEKKKASASPKRFALLAPLTSSLANSWPPAPMSSGRSWQMRWDRYATGFPVFDPGSASGDRGRVRQSMERSLREFWSAACGCLHCASAQGHSAHANRAAPVAVKISQASHRKAV